MTGAAARPGASLTDALLTDRDFARFQALIYREAGIHLTPVKRALLVGRLSRRIRELGLTSFGEYCDRVEADPAERVQMLDRITTNETHFFREPRHFELLSGQVLPRWRAEAEAGARPRKVRVWSAACSTGEEPWSIAMTLLRAFPPGSGFELEVLATDLSTRVLAHARDAIYSAERARELPEADLRAFMLRGTGARAGQVRVAPEVRALVEFKRLNLVEPHPGLGTFDLVFCRNVLIYFDAPTKEQVVEGLLEHLAPGGLLFLGHSESLSGTRLPVRSLQPTVYAHAVPGARRRAAAEAAP